MVVVGWRADKESWELLRPRVRAMRCAPTAAEGRLWQRLRRRQLGLRFRRQVAVGPFIVDFLCSARGVVVEVDGGAHEDRREADAERDAFLTANGLRVVRVTNDAVMHDLDGVIGQLVEALGR